MAYREIDMRVKSNANIVLQDTGKYERGFERIDWGKSSSFFSGLIKWIRSKLKW